MKFSIERNILAEALTSAAKASATRSSIPALEGLLINLKNGILTVTGYDLEMGIKCMIPVTESFEEGEIVVNSKVFGEMIRKMPAGVVNIHTENETNVFIKSGEIEFNIAGRSGQEYPNVPELNHDISFFMDEHVIKSMIRQTFHSISQNDSKPVHTGAKFIVENNQLSVVAVDSVRMAKREEKVEYNDITFVVPQKTLGELLRCLSDEETGKKVMICLDRNQICFSKDDYIIISRILEGDFIDYAKIMNFTEKMEAVINVREFAASLDRTLLLNNERYKSPVICTFDNDKLVVSCRSNIGTIRDVLDIKYGSEKLEIAFNARYMIDAIKNSECDEVRIQFTGPLSPIRVVPLGDKSFTAIILPVRNK